MIMQDSERVEYVMNLVNHPNYGWLVDVGNFMCADEDPQHAVGVAAPYAFHVHVKDFLLKKGMEDKPEGHWITTRGGSYLRGTVIGHGVVPVRPCLNILKNAGKFNSSVEAMNSAGYYIPPQSITASSVINQMPEASAASCLPIGIFAETNRTCSGNNYYSFSVHSTAQRNFLIAANSPLALKSRIGKFSGKDIPYPWI